MNTWRIKPLICMMVVLVLTLSACGTGMRGTKIPPPTLDYGWSPERMEFIKEKKTAVKCMTLDDIRKVDIYIELLKANEEVSQ